MVRNALIVVLMLVIFLLASALVRVENERYALWTGLCPKMQGTLSTSVENEARVSNCKNVQTRTGWWWHLYYAVTDKG